MTSMRLAVGVEEVGTPHAIVVVGLAVAVAHRIGPVRKTLLAAATDDGIEIGR